MNALFRPNADQVNIAQHLARLCETHAGNAARCRAEGNPAAAELYDSLAQGYSRDAFALAQRIAQGPRA